MSDERKKFHDLLKKAIGNLATPVSIVVVFFIGIVLFVYWRYAIHDCNSVAKNYANSAEKPTIDNRATAYNLSYKVCMRSKGF